MTNKPQFVGEKSGTTLKDSCVLIMGQSPSSNSYNTSGDGLPFYQGNADFGEESPVPRSWCTELKKIAEKGDILISVRAPIGAINIADEKCCIGRGVAAIRPNQEVMSPDFLQHQLFASRNKLEAMGTGSTFKAIGKKTLSDFPVVIYPKNTQEAIAQQLNLIKKQIKTVNSQLDQLDSLVKSRFVEMFGNPVDDKLWPHVTLAELCTKLGSGATPRGGRSTYKTEGIPLIRSMNVHNGYFVWKDLTYIDDEQAAKLNGVTLMKGDVLLNITGASVARSCILPDELAGGRVNQHVSIVRVDQTKMLPIILNMVLINDSYQRFLLNDSRMAGATREAITKEDLKSMKVPLPPLSLQQQFANFAVKVDKSRFISISRYRDILIKNGYRHPHLQGFNR